MNWVCERHLPMRHGWWSILPWLLPLIAFPYFREIMGDDSAWSDHDHWGNFLFLLSLYSKGHQPLAASTSRISNITRKQAFPKVIPTRINFCFAFLKKKTTAVQSLGHGKYNCGWLCLTSRSRTKPILSHTGMKNALVHLDLRSCWVYNSCITSK